MAVRVAANRENYQVYLPPTTTSLYSVIFPQKRIRNWRLLSGVSGAQPDKTSAAHNKMNQKKANGDRVTTDGTYDADACVQWWWAPCAVARPCARRLRRSPGAA